ncbi:hypothetical protein QQ054_04290 [Oscillatoria amoena NRMC-F 0135]|nr:hypothetical protein [Oscillatoria amoena NRMC-F 0135]
MKTTIFIIEDKKLTFNRYKSRIEELNLNVDFAVLPETCSAQIIFSDFLSKLKQCQPEIIFLDYELEWKQGGPDANEIIKSIKQLYSPLRFPPIIFLNTAKEERVQSIYDLLNTDKEDYKIPKEFVMPVTASIIDDGGEKLGEKIKTGINIVKTYRKPYNWDKDITFYGYPPANPRLSKADETYLSKQDWLHPNNKVTPPVVNKLSILLIVLITTYGAKKKDKRGCLFYLDEELTIHKRVFTFDSAEQIEDSVLNDEDYSPIRTGKRFYYNSMYIKKVLGGHYHFKKQYSSIGDDYFANKANELKQSGLSERPHLFYSQLTKIT